MTLCIIHSCNCCLNYCLLSKNRNWIRWAEMSLCFIWEKHDLELDVARLDALFATDCSKKTKSQKQTIDYGFRMMENETLEAVLKICQ